LAGLGNAARTPITDPASQSQVKTRGKRSGISKKFEGSFRAASMDRNDLINLINKRFSTVNGGLKFEIIRDGVRQDRDWWYVPVIATRNGKDVPREVTINIYANIETELEENDHVTVLFVPAVA
jgi:hypothetical protein